jgi:hypothetical protein
VGIMKPIKDKEVERINRVKTLEEVEQFRKLLIQSKTRTEIINEMGWSENVYKKVMTTYRNMFYSPEAIQQKASEDLEKLTVVEKKAFSDLLKEKIGYKDYIAVNEHNQKTKARYGYAPNDKIDIEHTGKINFDINSELRAIEEDLKKKRKEIEDE